MEGKYLSTKGVGHFVARDKSVIKYTCIKLLMIYAGDIGLFSLSRSSPSLDDLSLG